RREIVPACSAGSLRIRRDDFDTWFRQIVPIPNPFRVSLANKKHDRRSIRRASVRETRLPIGWNLTGMLGNGVDVVGESKRHDVGFQSVDNSARLFSRAAVRLTNAEIFACALLPLLLKPAIVFRVKFPGWIVRNVEQGATGAKRARGNQGSKKNTCNEFLDIHFSVSIKWIDAYWLDLEMNGNGRYDRLFGVSFCAESG